MHVLGQENAGRTWNGHISAREAVRMNLQPDANRLLGNIS